MAENNSKSVTSTDESSKVKKRNQQMPEKKVSDIKIKKQADKINIVKVTSLFLRDVKTELKKVKWPTRKELIAATTIVIILVIIAAVYLSVVDFGLMTVINKILG